MTPQVEQIAYRFIRAKCKELDVHVYALNGMPDHVHLVCSIPATIAVAKALKDIKGSSSHDVNELPGQPNVLYWQVGYSAFSVSKSDLARVIAYVEQQKERHAAGHL